MLVIVSYCSNIIRITSTLSEIVDFLRNLPELISQASRQIFSDNINRAEYWYRRLDNLVNVINVLLQRWEEQYFQKTRKKANSFFSEI